jgi:hypothetical protein
MAQLLTNLPDTSMSQLDQWLSDQWKAAKSRTRSNGQGVVRRSFTDCLEVRRESAIRLSFCHAQTQLIRFLIDSCARSSALVRLRQPGWCGMLSLHMERLGMNIPLREPDDLDRLRCLIRITIDSRAPIALLD